MSDPDKKRAALERLEAKSNFRKSFVVYLLVNLLLVIIWATDTSDSFWPIWPIAGWGIAIALQYWRAYVAKPITEADIQRELERGG